MENYEALIQSAVAHFETGEYDAAIEDCTDAIGLDPNNAAAFGTRGAAYKGKKDFDHAITDLSEAIRLDPNNAPAYGNRGLTYLNKGDYEHAIADLEIAVKLQPDNAGAREALERIKAEAKEDIEGVQNLDNPHAGWFTRFWAKLPQRVKVCAIIGGIFALISSLATASEGGGGPISILVAILVVVVIAGVLFGIAGFIIPYIFRFIRKIWREIRWLFR